MKMVTVIDIYQRGDGYSGLVGNRDEHLGTDCGRTREKTGKTRFAKDSLDFSDN